MKRIPSSILMILFPCIIDAYDIKVNGIYYNLDRLNQTAEITFGDVKYSGNIKIPPTLTYDKNTYKVVSVGAKAFEFCKDLTNVDLPNSITQICEGAFTGCSSLMTLPVSNKIKKIERNAFRGCQGLVAIILPNNVDVGERAFYYCTGLSTVKICDSVISIGKEAFAHCTNLSEVEGWQPHVDGEKIFYDTPFSWQDLDYFTYQYVYPKIKMWQQKGEYETTAQYQNRVTREKQQKEIQVLTAEATNEYIKEYTKHIKFNATLGTYNADNELYTLNSNYGIKYIKVPLSDAPSFKANYGNAKFDVSYTISGNKPQIADMTIRINSRTYQVEKNDMQLAENNFQMDLPEIDLELTQKQQLTSTTEPIDIDRSIDQNIPTVSAINANTFAVIIGNERYTQVARVQYANNDARIFAEYCKKTLGLPNENVKLYENATYGSMIGAISDIQMIAKVFKGNINVIFYYAGHGIPDEATGDSYLLPIDADGMKLEVCYPLNRLYKELGELQAQSVMAFMDACFSGTQRGDGMIVAARGVAIKAKSDHPVGNTIVFSASTDKQTAYPYKEKGHGLFTYYLLKKLRDTKGKCTLGELSSYVCEEVAKQSVITNGKEQTPVVLTSAGVSNNWQAMKLK